MRQNKKARKPLVFLFALALSFAVAGCGNDKGQETSEMPDAKTEESKAISAGTDVDTELEAEPNAETEEDSSFMIYDLMISEVNGEESTISPTVTNSSEEAVEASLQGFLLDGTAVDWHVSDNAPTDTYNPDSISFPLEPSTGRNLPIVLNANLYDYSEITVQASIIFADEREPLPISATFQISELVKPEDREPIQSSAPMIHIEAMELYNDNDITVTLPEQTLSPSGMPTFHLECQWEHGLYYSFLDLSVDGELIMKGSHSNADGEIDPNEPSDDPIPVDFWDAVNSGRDSGEITFVLDLWEDILSSIDKPEITISYTVVTE